MQKNKRVALLGWALVGLVSLGAVSFAYAYRGDSTQTGPNYSPERHTLMEKAFETNDYNLWKSQVANQGVTRKINESNFAKFSEAHRLELAGKYDEAQKIRTELNLGNGNGNGSGHSCKGDGTTCGDSCGCAGGSGTCMAK
ncbi:MAG: hypothetical protein WAV16_03690 [Candidatus Moraniibacteriota bacterium]